MTGPLRRLWLLAAVWTLSLLPADGMAATTAYVAATHHLNLNQVQFEVVASPEWTARLYDRTRAHFAVAGLPAPASPRHGSSSRTAILTLTVQARSLGNACPGKVLYASSLSLTEPVIVPRNSVIIRDTTWLLGTDTQVRDLPDISQLEADVDRIVRQFITDYKAGNPGWSSQTTTDVEEPGDGHETVGSLTPESNHAHRHASLNDLREHPVHLSVTAGRATELLRTRALHQLTEAGLRVSTERNGADTVTIDVEVVQQPIGDQCPGKVIYEQGLYLVEQIQIQRNPLVWIWTDTWLRETRQIVAPVPLHQLQADHDELFQQLLHSLTAP